MTSETRQLKHGKQINFSWCHVAHNHYKFYFGIVLVCTFQISDNYALGHLEKLGFQRHPAIEIHSLGRPSLSSNSQEN